MKPRVKKWKEGGKFAQNKGETQGLGSFVLQESAE
jgi:hypothetical protein